MAKRYIDADELMEKVAMLFREDKAPSVTDYNHGVADAVAIIKNLPTAQRWIPCKERVPKNSAQVLVTLADEEVTIDEYWHYAKDPEDEGWGLSRIGVVAWMPLPEPYKEVTE